MDIGVGGIAISVGTLLGVFLGLLDLAFLNHFFALDHAPSAVLTAVLALFTRHPAAGAIVVVNDLRADDLLLLLLVGAEAKAPCDPFDELGKQYDGHSQNTYGNGYTYETENDVKSIRSIVTASASAVISRLVIDGESESIVGIYHFHGVFIRI